MMFDLRKIILLNLCLAQFDLCFGERYLINKVCVGIADGDRARYLTLKDFQKPRLSLGGERESVYPLIENEVYLGYAASRRMYPSASELDRQIESLKASGGMSSFTDQQFKDTLFKELALTLPEYRKQLAEQIALQRCKSSELSDGISITRDDVISYYEKNPVYTPESYRIAMAKIPEGVPAEEFKLNLIAESPAWKSLGLLKRDEIDVRFHVIFSMIDGEISDPIVLRDGSSVFVKRINMIPSGAKPLSERYLEIESLLRKKSIDEKSKTFLSSLFKKAQVIFYS